MPRLLLTIIIVIVAAFILVPQAFFTVDETQLAIVTRFGAFQRDYRSPWTLRQTAVRRDGSKDGQPIVACRCPTGIAADV